MECFLWDFERGSNIIKPHYLLSVLDQCSHWIKPGHYISARLSIKWLPIHFRRDKVKWSRCGFVFFFNSLFRKISKAFFLSPSLTSQEIGQMFFFKTSLWVDDSLILSLDLKMPNYIQYNLSWPVTSLNGHLHSTVTIWSSKCIFCINDL